MLKNIATLRAQLTQCETKIYLTSLSKLNQCEARFKQGKPIDKALGQLIELIDKSTKLAAQRRSSIGHVELADLPVTQSSDEITKAIEDNQVVIIAGETGSGKTTQLPKICMQMGYGAKGLIGHTQPRRLAARTVATRIAQELGSSVGQKVGYQVRFTEEVGDNSLVKLMTDGILLAETQNDPLLEKYQVLILDEAHERSLNIDFLLGYIKRILPKRPDLKLIITSATIDLQRFSEHFNNAPIIEVSGRTFPVEVLYRPLLKERSDSDGDKKELTLSQGVVAAVEEIISLQKKDYVSGPRDILIFFSGEREIRENAEALRKAQLANTQIMPLYARLSVKEQSRIFNVDTVTGRRIILATNVAETSVTVPGIGFVIDTGLARVSRYSYRSKVQRLPIEKISQASANQRAGRCGRIAPGTCIRLFSEEDYLSRAEFTDAEIRRTNLAAVILQMLNLKLGSIHQFPFIDPPDSRFVNDGFSLLEELGAVNKQKTMTPLGRKLAKLPVDPRIGRMIIEANNQGALKEVLIIASALSVQDPKERPIDKQQAADQVHKEHQDDDSDFISFVNLWNLYEQQRQELSSNQLRKYCSKHFLSFMRMREWRDVHRQLYLASKAIGFNLASADASYESVHVSLLSGLLSHIGVKQENNEFLGARNRKFFIFPASTQYKKPAKWLMVSELVETTRLFGRNVAKIEPQWVEPLAKHLIKKNYLEPKWQKKRAQVSAYEQVMLYGLLLVNNRVVNYGAINPQESQQIFIRTALVEGHFHTKGQFFKHNRALLDSVELLEAKSRRKDLLIDEDGLYDFYAQKITSLSEHPIVNGAGFEKWRQKIEKVNPQVLFMSHDDILQRTSDHIGDDEYPDCLSFKGIELELSYHFDPLAKDDGVSLHLPMALLKQFPKERLQWLVPGLIKERCIALLKSLPKARRKHFVPIPDYVSAFLQSANYGVASLFEQLAHHLLRMSGIELSVEEFNEESLAQHLHFNIKLLGNDQKIIDEGRDLAVLIDKYAHQIDEKLQQQGEQEWGQRGLESWSFDELPEQVQVKHSGIMVTAWPSLVLKDNKVDLKLQMDQQFALQQTVTAITFFAVSLLANEIKKLKSAIPKINESTLLMGKKFNKKLLESEIISLCVREGLKLNESLPANKQEFLERVDTFKKSAELSSLLKKVGQQVYDLHQQYHQLYKQLNGSQSLATILIVSDIKQQLESLFPKTYLSHISWFRLCQYTRYMKSVEIRLEKYQRELPQQKLYSAQINEWEQLWQAKSAYYLTQYKYDNHLAAFRWLIEEYRISVFSQQIKTLESVSQKRMKQKWQDLNNAD